MWALLLACKLRQLLHDVVRSLCQRRFLHVRAHLVRSAEVIDCSLVLVPSCLSGFTVCVRTLTFSDFPCISNTHSRVRVRLLQSLVLRFPCYNFAQEEQSCAKREVCWRISGLTTDLALLCAPFRCLAEVCCITISSNSAPMVTVSLWCPRSSVVAFQNCWAFS